MSAITSLSAFGWAKQESAVGYTYGISSLGQGRTFETTANGTAITIVASTVAAKADSNDDIVGAIVEVVRCSNGGGGEYGAPLRSRVLGYSHSTETLTIESLGFSTVDGDQFRIISDPGGIWVDDTGGSSTKVQDANRDEANAYWVGSAARGGPYAVCVVGANVAEGAQKLITAFTSANGDLTVASLGASTAVGDVFEAIQWPEVFSGAPIALTQARVDRTSRTGSFGIQHGVAGLREGSGTVELAWRGPGSGSVGEPAELDTPLGAVTTATASGADEAIAATTSTTSVNVGSAVTLGSAWLTEAGDVCVATTAADPFVPSPTLRSIPATGSPLYALRRYTPATALAYALKIHQWHGQDLYDQAVGVAPTSIKISAQRGEFCKVEVGLAAADFHRHHLDQAGTQITRAVDPILPTVTPRACHDVRVVLDGVELEARSVSLDLGLDVQPRVDLNAPNKHGGFALRGDAPVATIDLYLDADALAMIRRMQRGVKARMLIQIGSTGGDPGVLAFWANQCEITAFSPGDDAGAITAQLTVRVTHDTSSSLPRWQLMAG